MPLRPVIMVNSFQIARTPFLLFGAGSRKQLPILAGKFGKRLVLVSGAHVLQSSGLLPDIENSLIHSGFRLEKASVAGEPSPELIDQLVKDYRSFQPDVIMAIGGGSVLDSGKALSAMLPLGEPVIEYLEGVGTKQHDGRKIPVIAVPTTAGTGSEATKNAVLSRVGEKGFKKSLRHDNFIPDFAVLDPELTYSCPPDVTAASGMDCLTQLVESYVSTSANPFTDALALPAIENVLKYLPKVYANPAFSDGRAAMLYAAYVSGITLAAAGLGTVHGIASAIGGIVPVPHGIICGTIMAEINNMTMRKLLTSEPENIALKKYVRIAENLAEKKFHSPADAVEFLSGYFTDLTKKLRLPKLSKFGVTKNHIQSAAGISENKNNPVPLTIEEIEKALYQRW